MTYNLAQIKDSVQRVVKFIETNKKAPLTVRVNKDTLKWQDWKKLPEIVDAETRLKNWIKNKKIYPNYVTTADIKVDKKISQIIWSDIKLNNNTTTNSTNSTTSQTRFVNTPFLLDPNWMKQDYKADCALNSLQQCFYNLTGIKVSESTMMKLGYTGSGGTSHDGIRKVVSWFNREYNQNITIEFRNLKDYGSSSKEQWTNIGKQMTRKDTSIFFHIYYRNGGNSCTSSIIAGQDYGHYEVLDIINVGTGYVRALNSLSGGYLQNRKISVQECFMRKISQPSIAVLTKK